MKQFLKTSSRRIGYVIATTLSAILILLIVVIAGLQGAVIWLNTDKGGQWLAGEITKAVEETPYKISMENFQLHGLFGIGADRLVISDSEGAFLNLEDAGVDLDIWPLPMKTAWLNIDAQTAELSRIPKPPEKNLDRDPEREAVFPERPDVYFNALVLNLNIKQFSIADNIIAGGTTGAVKARQTFDLREEYLGLKGQYNLTGFNGGVATYFPEDLKFDARGLWGQDVFEIRSFDIARDEKYSARGEALYNPIDNIAKLKSDAKIMAGLSPNLTKPLDIKLDIEGGVNNYAGEISAKGEIKNQPVDIQSPVQGTQEYIKFTDLNGDAAGSSVNGHLQYYFTSGLMQGEIDAGFKNFDLIESLSGLNGLQGNGHVKLNLAINDNHQVYSGNANLKNILYKTTRIDSAVIDAVPTNNFNVVTTKFDIRGFDGAAFDLKGNALVNVPNQTIKFDNAIFKSKGGDIRFNGLASEHKLDMVAKFNKLDLTRMPFVSLEDSLPVVINSGTVTLTGNAASPIIVADLNAIPSAPEGDKIKLKLNGVYQNHGIDLDSFVTGPGINTLTAKVKVPADISFSPFVFNFSNDAPLSGQLNGDFNLAGISGPFLPEGNKLSGQVFANTEVAGIVSAPVLNGRANLQNGRYLNQNKGIDFRDMQARLLMSGKNVIVESLTATDGGNGRLNMNGNINFENGFPPVANLSATAKHMKIMQDTKYQIALNADMDLITKPEGGYVVTGTAFPDKIIYTLPDHFDKKIPELNIVDPNAEARDPLLELIALDMIFDSREKVFIRGWGLDVQLGGKLYIGGTAEDPDVRGNLGVVRGNYEEFGRRFDLADSKLRFQGEIPPSPYLNITAVTEVDGYDLKVLIRGTALDPKVSFASSPSMAEDQVLSYILFGKDASQISPFQALQLANTLRRFSGKGGGLDPIGQLQKATGLDDLRIEGGTGEGVTVGAGKYLSDDVYLEVQQNSGDEGAGAARVEIELTPRITVESQVGSRGETGGGIFWEWDY